MARPPATVVTSARGLRTARLGLRPWSRRSRSTKATARGLKRGCPLSGAEGSSSAVGGVKAQERAVGQFFLELFPGLIVRLWKAERSHRP